MMSSATSISNTDVRVQPSHDAPAGPDRAEAFRPWHFFVLASLIAATAAVMLSRESTPEHLVLISVIIAAAGLAAAAFHRMLAPLAAEDVMELSEPLSDRTRAALEREKALTLRSIKELEFDRAMGKVSEKDFDEMGGRLRSRALLLMKQLEEGSDGYRTLIERELSARLADRAARLKLGTADATARSSDDRPVEPQPRTAVCRCGVANDSDALFCKRCGSSLAAGIPGDRGGARDDRAG